MNLKQKIDSIYSLCKASFLVPYPNKFLVVSICILILHGLYSPLPTDILLWGAKYFFCVLKLGAGKISNFLETFCTGRDIISFWLRAARPFSSIKPSSYKLKNCWWRNYLLHVSMLTFHTFAWEFSLFKVYSIILWNSQRRTYCCLVITLWKCEYCLIWALSKSILFGSNSMKVSVLCDMNSKKTRV